MEKKLALIVANLAKEDADSLVKDIESKLIKNNFDVQKICFRNPPEVPEISNISIAFSLGGDGTVLFTSRIIPEGVPIFAINLGDVGFITEIAKNEWEHAFKKYMSGELGISSRKMLNISVERKGKSVAMFSGLNDAVVSSKGISKLIKLEVSVESSRIGKYRADGVIIATPTGSTAYSAAAGGPLLFPEIDAMIITPICPFSLSNRPLVVPATEAIYVKVEKKQRTDIILTVDGQLIFNVEPEDTICFKAGRQDALIIRSDKRSFYEVLRSKLKWSGGPDD